MKRHGLAFSILAVLFLVLATAIPARAQGTRYFADVTPGGRETAARLAALHFDVAGVDYDTGAVGVVATQEELDRLAPLGLAFSVRDASHPLRQTRALTDYMDPSEMETYLNGVVAAYPGLVQKVLLEDTLFEGQKVWALKITKDPGLPNLRPRFMMDCQHHAREVMTSEIARDMIDYLTSKYATDAQVKNWVDNLEIWIVPMVNPDGIAAVFSVDNMWRRNRHPGCPVDVNRNYNFLWGACNGSTASCTDDTNRGSAGDSEPETQAIVALTAQLRPFFALTYHSYGQYILYSYGCSDSDEMAAEGAIAQGLNAILLKDDGNPGGWATGPIWSTIYSADGGSLDSQYARYGTYAYCIEVNSSSFQPDYATWRGVTVQRQRTAWQWFLDKTLQAPQVRGRITDAGTGAPLPATVSVQEVTYTHGELPRTADERGLYHWLTAANTTVHLTVSYPGYCSQTLTVGVGTGPITLDVALTYPAAPLSISAVAAGDNRIDLSWGAVAGATEYRVYRALSSGGPYSLVKTVAAPGTSASDAPVSGQVTYYYTVRSFTSCESPNSTEVSARATGACTQTPVFAGVSGVAPTYGATCSLTLSWAAAAGYCGGPATYRVYRSTASPFTPAPGNLVAAAVTGTSYTDHAALANGSTYYYIVRAVDGGSAEEGNTVTRGGTPLGPLVSGTWSDDAGDTGTAQMALSSPWSTLATGGKTGPKVYATGTTASNLCAAITTPAIALGAAPTLTFASKYDLETNYDAGIVEVAPGPAFTSWTRLAVNYPNTLNYSGNACGIATGGAGTAFSQTYTTPAYSASAYTGSLAAYANQTVKIRWRVSTDSGVNGKGWWVDDIKVAGALLPGTCAAGVAPNPKEASPQGSPMTCSRGTGSSVALTFTPACGALDTAVYRGTGPIVTAPAWTAVHCSLGTAGRASFDPGDPPAGSFFYFVAVGQTASKEGSFGQSFNGTTYAERAEAAGVGACDRAQDLAGSCP